MMQILPTSKVPERACNGVTKNIRASAISRQRRETLDSPQTRKGPGSYGAQSARFILDSRLPTSASPHLRKCNAERTPAGCHDDR
jgi:hypothetical protein